MSGLILLVFAGLLAQDVAPPPANRAVYEAPAIRPFEPGPGFEDQRAQGDADSDPPRRALEAPVTVEAYARSYEPAPDAVEQAYQQGVTSAELRADQSAGGLDGAWRIMDPVGRALFDLVLIDPGAGPAEGGWRSGSGRGAATADGRVLTLEGAGTVTLERTDGGWRGELSVDGRRQTVSLVRPR